MCESWHLWDDDCSVYYHSSQVLEGSMLVTHGSTIMPLQSVSFRRLIAGHPWSYNHVAPKVWVSTSRGSGANSLYYHRSPVLGGSMLAMVTHGSTTVSLQGCEFLLVGDPGHASLENFENKTLKYHFLHSKSILKKIKQWWIAVCSEAYSNVSLNDSS